MCRRSVQRDKLRWCQSRINHCLIICMLFPIFAKRGRSCPVFFPHLWALKGEHWLSAFRQTLTGDGEHVGLDLSFDLEATSPLGVIRPTQAGHVGHAALVDVHHTVWSEARQNRNKNNNKKHEQIWIDREEVMRSLILLRQHWVTLDSDQGASPWGCWPSVEATANQLPSSTPWPHINCLSLGPGVPKLIFH